MTEQFETLETNSLLPQDPEKRKKMYTYLQEAFGYHKDMEDLKADIDNCADISAEELGVKKVDFKNILKAMIDEDKFKKEIAHKEEVLASKEILENMNG